MSFTLTDESFCKLSLFELILWQSLYRMLLEYWSVLTKLSFSFVILLEFTLWVLDLFIVWQTIVLKRIIVIQKFPPMILVYSINTLIQTIILSFRTVKIGRVIPKYMRLVIVSWKLLVPETIRSVQSSIVRVHGFSQTTWNTLVLFKTGKSQRFSLLFKEIFKITRV